MLVELTDPNALPYDAGAYYFVPMRSVPHAAAEVALARPVVHAMLESPRPWIREGLTGFAQALMRERQGGRRAALAYLGQFGSALAVAEAQSHSSGDPGERRLRGRPQPPSDRSRSSPPRTKFSSAPKPPTSGGCCAIWWATTRCSRHWPHYRAAEDRDTGYLQRLIEKRQYRRSAIWKAFFDDWVYRDRGLPQLQR